jgi:ElaB/YqjD/DUF883 family membrane-anchored ribosome-binding protein
MQQRRDDIVDDSPLSQRAGFSDSGQRSTGRNNMSDTADRAQDKASEIGGKAQRQAEVGVDKAAEGMHSAADKIRERASNQGGMAADAGMKVADSMDKTAGYLREHDTAEILDDVEKYVRDHPMQAVAGAVIGGFVIGRILR